MPHLADVDQPGQAQALAVRSVRGQRVPDCHRPADRDDVDAGALQVEPEQGRGRPHRSRVAATLDEDRSGARRLGQGQSRVSLR